MDSTVLSTKRPQLTLAHLGWIALLGNVQLLAVVAYFTFTSATLTQPRYVLYGLLWLNVGLLVFLTARPPRGVDFGARRRALAVAVGYFGLLAVFGGLVNPGVGEHATGFRVAWLPPGWGPAFVYAGSNVVVAVMPAFLIGYLSLSYLVYITVVEASRSLVAGIVGLFSCVSCTWPIVAAVASSLLGGAGILGATALDASYDLSTAVYLLTVVLLYWRPGFR